MDRNIRIARQLVKIAKELVASRSRTAIYMPFAWACSAFKPQLGNNWKEANTFGELLSICNTVNPYECKTCLIPSANVDAKQAEKFFNMYGAPFYVYCKNGNEPVAIMHMKTHQLKNISDDRVVTDEEILRTAAGRLVLEAYRTGNTKWSYVESECVNDFSGLKKYIEEAKAEWSWSEGEDDFHSKFNENNNGETL